MRNREGHTPKTLAYDIAIGWIANAAKGRTNDVVMRSPNDAFERETLRQLAIIHNRLLEKSNLDGVGLPEEKRNGN